jgi:hypothetical protein
MTLEDRPALTSEELLAIRRLWARPDSVISSTVTGSSMGVTIPEGAQIRIRPLRNPDELRKGGVIAFVEQNKVFAHRIVRRGRCGVLTRGDARTMCDRPIPPEAVIGEVTDYCKNGEWMPVSCKPAVIPRSRWKAAVATFLPSILLDINLSLARFACRAIFGLGVQRWGGSR